MKRLILSAIALCSLSLAQGTQKLEPSSKATYFASAGTDKWSGQTPLETLDWRFDVRRPLETQFSATLRPAKFNSGNGIRDDNARNNVFRVDRFPIITVRSSSISGEKGVLVSGETRTFKVKAKLEMAGLSRDIEFPLEVYFDGNNRRVSGEASLKVSLDAYKLERPEFLWLKVDDAVRVEILLETTL